MNHDLKVSNSGGVNEGDTTHQLLRQQQLR